MLKDLIGLVFLYPLTTNTPTTVAMMPVAPSISGNINALVPKPRGVSKTKPMIIAVM
jgi:hypothetical protein